MTAAALQTLPGAALKDTGKEKSSLVNRKTVDRCLDSIHHCLFVWKEKYLDVQFID